MDPRRLVFCGATIEAPLLALDAPFGVTLLATPRRDRLVAILSSALGTYSLGASFDAASRRAFTPLLERASTVGTDEDGLEAIGPDGAPLLFAPDELASLLDALVEHSPSCLERLVLTDARGAPLTCDGRYLRCGERTVDLSLPLEWRSILFQEGLGRTAFVYQGTWIRQSSTEFVLVALMPSIAPQAFTPIEPGSVHRGFFRDMRLMQASVERPPPPDQRVAIERLFMLPVRAVLDRAPRAPQKSRRAQA